MAMVRILGYSSNGASETDGMPKEIVKSPSPSGDSGWLIRFFDSAFFCEWIAVSYLYKHEHSGVRDYLCNRMYSLPLSGIEGYLFQLSYMLLTKPSPSLDKYIVDMCSKSLRIAIKVHWFLLAEAEDSDDCEEIIRLQERCQRAAVTGTWPPLVRPNTASPKSRMFKILSSRRILPLASSIPIQKSNSQGSSAIITDDVTGEVVRSKVPPEDSDSSLKVLKRLMPGPKVRDAFFKKFRDKEDEETDQSKEAEQESFFRRIFREKDDDEKAVRNEDLTSIESFFRRIFRERTDASDDEEKESFFRKLFRDKHDDREKVDDEDKVIEEEEGPEFFLFRKFYKVHPEEDDKNIATLTENTAVGTPENSPGTEGFFKRLFRDRPLEDGKVNGRKEDRSSPSSFLKRLFKERIEEAGLAEDLASMSVNGEEHEAEFVDNHLLPKSTNPRAKNGFPDVSSEFIASQTLDFSVCHQNADDMHSTKIVFEDVVENANCKDTATSGKTSSNLAVHKIFNASEWSLTSSKPSNKRPGSPKQKTEMASSKPPLPKYSSFQIRKGTYHATLDFVKSLCDIASGLVDVFPLEHRQKALYESLAELNSHLAESDKGVCFPMGKGLYRIIHIPEDEAVLMNSREKAPFLVCFEVLKCDDQIPTKDQKDFIINKVSQGGIPLANSDAQLQRPPPWAYPPDSGHFLRSASRAIDQAMAHHWETKMKVVDVNFSICARPLESSSMQSQEFSDGASLIGSNGCTVLGKVKDCEEILTDGDQCHLNGSEQGEAIHQNSGEHGDWVTVKLRAIPGMNMEDVEDDVPIKRRDHRRVPSTIAMAQVREAAAKGEAPPGLPVKKGHPGTQDHIGFDVKATDALAGELWEHKRERIRKLSSFGAMPGWDLCSVIVKSGDDCRQEHLAVQLVSHFYDIFQEAGLPLWLRPYEVIVTSSHAALIETIPDTASIHAIKSRNSRLSSLREFFCNKYDENSPAFKLAQRNFVESMAGYSILCYILQVKDRHNANLLIDEDGHIIHIDFGFMLSNSPGGVNFESAPFKLTRELLEVMDSDAEGTASEFFDYFKVLCIQGFLTCRKHAERIILLVEMMQESGCPCFKGGPRAIQNLRKRFHLGLTEEQCVSLVLSLISSSLDAWRTRQYDYYQRVLNGIL